MSKEELIEFLKENLEIVTDLKTTSEYIGDMGQGSSLYRDSHTLTVKIILANEVISESEEYLS